jgi:hypothetical protein
VKTANDLLLVLTTAPVGVDEEYNAWYDEEHAPARLGVPGIRTARRYRDTATSRNYLACYDLDSADILDQPAYLGLSADASARERRIVPRIAPDRRVYQAITTPEVSRAKDEGVCGGLLLAVWWTPAPGADEELDAWYGWEHIPLLMNVPGWLRVRRYSLLAGNGPRYLALHDLSTPEALQERAHAATRTPSRERLAASRREYDRRLFRLWRRFDAAP